LHEWRGALTQAVTLPSPELVTTRVLSREGLSDQLGRTLGIGPELLQREGDRSE
jgi:hypothetical protein